MCRCVLRVPRSGLEGSQRETTSLLGTSILTHILVFMEADQRCRKTKESFPFQEGALRTCRFCGERVNKIDAIKHLSGTGQQP